jgi:predicted GNAT family N-acyltransferase
VWRVEPYDKSRHERTGFDCGDPALNDFLATKVSQWDRKGLCRTYVALAPGTSRVLGYYTLSSHHLEYDSLAAGLAKGLPRIDVPVVLLGRLAVDLSTRGQGLGRFLLMNALSRVAQVAERLGIQAVEVDAVDEIARQFYRKYGFVALEDDRLHLYLSVKSIARLGLLPPDP